MLFRRRSPRPLVERLRTLVWPRGGWRRTAYYVGHRLGRIPGTPYRVAAGFACGAAISFTPLIGMHFVGAALLALLLRGNLLASAIGTAVGNPWTFPLIWAWTYALGRWILGRTTEIGQLPQNLSMAFIFEYPLEVFLPMLVGSLPTAVVAWFAFFWPVQRIVDGYQRARRLRIFKRRRALRQQYRRRERAQSSAEEEK